MTDQPRDWAALLAGAVRLDKDEVKSALPLEWVLLREGVLLEPDGERLRGLCPFHDETTPSFAVFGEALDRCGCWSCSFTQGDVFDFLMRRHGEGFPEALRRAGRYLEEFRQDEAWRPRDRTATARPKLDPADLTAQAAEYWRAAGEDASALHRLIREKQDTGNRGWAFTADWLRQEWFVGALDDWTVAVPHYSLADDGSGWVCRGLKTRTPRSHLYARSGSDLSHLYGEWRDRGHEVVVVVEGESDAWATSWAFRDAPVDVLAVPTGAGTPCREPWAERLAGRHVILAGDGDHSGRTFMRRWHRALAARAASVRVCPLPDGQDMASVADLQRAVSEATTIRPEVGNVAEANGVYVRMPAGDGAPVPVSNWCMVPDRELTFEDGARGYEGRLADGREVVLTASDLESESAVTKWSSRHGGNWLGSKRDAQALLGLLESEGPFLARGHATRVAGWHDGNFVWPGGRIGPDYWVYLPPSADVGLQSMLELRAGPWETAAVEAMLSLHLPGVMTPFLAWMAAAPLRSMFRRFPPLAITGSSGSGKTTLVEAVLRAFGMCVTTNLTATTPHAVHSFAAATNGIPVWFDEYRPGARDDTLQTVNQVLRDAWAAQPSFKGGLKEDKSALTALPTSSPLVVTGEDAFSETSHVERLALVNLPSDGKSKEALQALRAAQTAGLGHSYLSWLVLRWRDGSLPSLAVDETVGRIESNRRVLEVGWELLGRWHVETSGRELPPPDWSVVRQSVDAAAAVDPITDAMVWAMGQLPPGGPVVWTEQADVLVKVEDFLAMVDRSGQFTLPGRRRAVQAYLADRYGGAVERHPNYGRVTRLPGLAAAMLSAT